MFYLTWIVMIKKREKKLIWIKQLISNVSLVVEFQRWWALKSKLFAKESTCWMEILIPTTLNYLWYSVVFFWFFPLKLVFFWTKSRKNIYGCYFHSICATDLKFGVKNNVRTTLKTLIFPNYWGSKVVQSSFLWACWFLGKNLAF